MRLTHRQSVATIHLSLHLELHGMEERALVCDVEAPNILSRRLTFAISLTPYLHTLRLCWWLLWGSFFLRCPGDVIMESSVCYTDTTLSFPRGLYKKVRPAVSGNINGWWT